MCEAHGVEREITLPLDPGRGMGAGHRRRHLERWLAPEVDLDPRRGRQVPRRRRRRRASAPAWSSWSSARSRLRWYVGTRRERTARSSRSPSRPTTAVRIVRVMRAPLLPIDAVRRRSRRGTLRPAGRCCWRRERRTSTRPSPHWPTPPGDGWSALLADRGAAPRPASWRASCRSPARRSASTWRRWPRPVWSAPAGRAGRPATG